MIEGGKIRSTRPAGGASRGGNVGLADPRALEVANAAKETLHFRGTGGDLALALAVVYMPPRPSRTGSWKPGARRFRRRASIPPSRCRSTSATRPRRS